MSKESFVIVAWPEVQDWMLEPGFEENAHPILDQKGMDMYGSAFFIKESWMEERNKLYEVLTDYIVTLCQNKKVSINPKDVNDFVNFCERDNIKVREVSRNSNAVIYRF